VELPVPSTSGSARGASQVFRVSAGRSIVDRVGAEGFEPSSLESHRCSAEGLSPGQELFSGLPGVTADDREWPWRLGVLAGSCGSCSGPDGAAEDARRPHHPPGRAAAFRRSFNPRSTGRRHRGPSRTEIAGSCRRQDRGGGVVSTGSSVQSCCTKVCFVPYRGYYVQP
jgi:hypothetical protein